MQKDREHILSRALLLVFITLIVNIIILTIKFTIYLKTMSIAALTYLFDTIMDMQNDVISIVGLKKAKVPPDKDHPYGHAKYDALVAVITATFIVAIMLEIAFETITKTLEKSYEIFFDQSIVFFFIILIIIYCIITAIQSVFAKKYKILIIETTAVHYITDPMFSILVLIGIFLASKKLLWIDLVVSLVIIVVILRKSFSIIKRSSKILLDAAVIDEQELRTLIINSFKGKIIDCIDICSRTDGEKVFLEMRIKMDRKLSLEESDKITHEVENFIRQKYNNLKFGRIIIHQEPN